METLEGILNSFARKTNGELRQASLRFDKGKKRSPITKTVRVNGREFQAQEESLKNSFRHEIGKKRGKIEKVQLKYAYHALFLEKGFGRGNKNRVPKPFYTPILKRNVSKLADEVNEIFAEKTVKNIFI